MPKERFLDSLPLDYLASLLATEIDDRERHLIARR